MLQEGKALLFGETLNENRFNFEFNFQLNEKNYKYKFDFNKKEDLPHRINVLIGKNFNYFVRMSQSYFLQYAWHVAELQARQGA